MNKVNYHTHTYRCGHGLGDEQHMCQAAYIQGYTKIGFSEHVPLPRFRQFLIKGLFKSLENSRARKACLHQIVRNGPNMRMPYKTRLDHQKNVIECKNKYKGQMEVYQGYECEVFPQYFKYYQSLLDNHEVDYLILGNHFKDYHLTNKYYGKDNTTDEDIMRYRDDVIKAIHTGLFSYIAHPDLFMLGHPVFNETCKQVTIDICKEALKYDIPLEINAGGIRQGLRKVEDEMLYPYTNSHFFDIVGEIGNKVIIGMDAHKPSDFNEEDYQTLITFAKKHKLNLINEFEFKKGK